MVSDKELLEETSFERQIIPKDETGNLLRSLLKKRAFSNKRGIKREKYPIKESDLNKLKKLGIVASITASPEKLHLTEKGKIVAFGEYSLSKRESQ